MITNDLLDEVIAEQLPEISRAHILSEPAARNTAPACALAAFLLEKTEPETVIGIFPSDHVVKNVARFADVIRAGIAVAASGRQDCCAGGSSDASRDRLRIYRVGCEGGETQICERRDCGSAGEAIYRKTQCGS